jgi:hypothetical protein
MGIEPTYAAWEAAVLPLNYTRSSRAFWHAAGVSVQPGQNQYDGPSRDGSPRNRRPVRPVNYPAGFTNTWHTHPCAHDMHVREGTLVTHDGAFGLGSFVRFPEGMKMQHGATQAEDAAVLFLTNKKFEIGYAQQASAGGKFASN